MRIAALSVVALLGCDSASNTPSTAAADATASEDAGDSGAGDANDVSPKATLDKTALGQVCTKPGDCPPDEICLSYKSIDPSVSDLHCALEQNACTPVTCPTGYSCTIKTTAVGTVGCQKD